MGIMRTIRKLNVELLLIVTFIGFSVWLGSLWPACAIIIGILVQHALLDFYNYKHTNCKIIQSDELQAELDLMRQANLALAASVKSTNEGIQSIKTTLSLGRR